MNRFGLVLIVVCFSISSFALAQTELEAFLGVYDPGSELNQADFDRGVAMGFRFGHSFLAVLGTEFSYTAATGLQDRLGTFDENIHLLNGNFLVQLPVGGFVPFATVGLGSIIGQTDTSFKIRSAWTWNAGGGLKIRNIAGPVGVRFDVRYYAIPDGIEVFALPPDLNRENFNLMEVSGGLLLTF